MQTESNSNSTHEAGTTDALPQLCASSEADGRCAEHPTFAAESSISTASLKQSENRFAGRIRILCSLAVVSVFSLAMLGSGWDYTSFSGVPRVSTDYSGTGTIIAPSASGNAFGLQRQTDCSITKYEFSGGTAFISGALVSTTPEFQKTLHTAAQLTTVGGTWPNGCQEQVVGISSRLGAGLGTTKDGSSMIGAAIDENNNLYAATLNLITGSYSVSQLLTGTAVALLPANIEGTQFPDLLVETFSSSSGTPITVYHNNGDGTFTAGTTLLSGVSASGFTVDDVNGDGKLDLIVDTYTQIMVLLGNGDGTFGSPITSTLPFATQGDELATGDFNGDGKKDLVTTNGAILLGDGAGHFTATSSRIAVSASGVVVGDWNIDGNPDIAFITTGALGGIVTVYLGNGDGTFAQGNSYATIGGVTFLSASDLDGDGDLDIYVGEANSGDYGPDLLSGGASQALMGNGDGTFAGAQAYPNGTNGGSTRSSVQPFAVASFHGTGYQDVLMQTDTGIEMLTNNGKGSFTSSQVLPGSVSAAMATADIDGDGKNDAVFGEGSSGSFDIAVALGNGDGTFQTKITTAVPALPNRLVVGDSTVTASRTSS
jgi:hypothetical protein